MSSQRIILCDACHKREATCHLNKIVDGKIKSTDLCSQCYEAREPIELKESRRAAEAARCEYCGAQPCVDWHSLTNISAIIVAPEEARFLCSSCSEEYNRFLAHKLASVPEGLAEAEQLAKFGGLRDAAHAHMMDWLAKNRS
jgi:protein-arginine kinase activator protein McsA